MKGTRNGFLTSLAGTMRRRGMTEDEILNAIAGVNQNRCDPPLGDGELRRIARSVAGYAPAESPNGHEAREDGALGPSQASPSLIVPGRSGRSNLKHSIQAVSFHGLDEPPPRKWLINNLIPERAPCLGYGDGGVAKSYVSADMGIAVARDADCWLGHEVQEAGPVLYLDFELDQDEQLRRVYRLARGSGLSRPPEGFYYMSALGYPARDAFQAALEVCDKERVKLMVLDSINPALAGDAEASKDVIGFSRNFLDPFREVGTSIFAIDHQAKIIKGERQDQKRAFGSVFKENLSRSVIHAIRADGDKDSLTVNLHHTKSNFGPRQDQMSVLVNFGPAAVTVQRLDEVVEVAKPKTARDKVLDALKEGGDMYPAEIAEITKVSEKTVKNTVSSLRGEGLVENTGATQGNAQQVRYRPKRPSLIRDGDGRDASDGGNIGLDEHGNPRL